MSDRKAFVYILECGDGSLYTGWAFDVEERVQKHKAGKGGRYTRSHLPLKLVYVRQMKDKIAAMRWEHSIKRMDRSTKLKHIEAFQAGLEKYLSQKAENHD
jgi:putative endonuclease